MNTFRRCRPTRIAALALPLLFCATAQAAPRVNEVTTAPDTKSLPGNACNPSAASVEFLRIDSKILNIGVLTSSFVCPFVRDLHYANRASNIAFTDVWVIDNSARAAVTCRLASYNAQGEPGASITQSTDQDQNSPDPVRLTFGTLATPKHGTVTMNCFVPEHAGDRSGIVSYTYQEAPQLGLVLPPAGPVYPPIPQEICDVIFSLTGKPYPGECT